MTSHRIPPNLFGIALGLAGLASAWRATEPVLGTPHVLPDAIDILAAVAWLVLVIRYLAQGPRQIRADLADPVLAPFVSVAPVAAMLLSTALASHATQAGRILVMVFLGVTVALGGWLTGQWIVGDLDQEKAHPGYLIPTVAGGLVGAYAAAEVGLPRLAEASFGLGVVCWLVLGSVVLNRLFFRRWLPDPLAPTLAIEVAPPALAGLAYFALDGRVASLPACALGGYTVLMALVQLRLVPRYRKLKFSPGFWAFTFAYAAAVTYAIQWVTIEHPPGARLLAGATAGPLTGLIAAITIRTIRAARRGELLPPVQPAATGHAAPAELAGAAHRPVSA